MKRLLLCCIIFIVSLHFALQLADQNSGYIVERDYWHLQQQYQNLLLVKDTSPNVVYDGIIESYQKFINKFPDEKLTILAKVFLGRIYLLKNEPQTARSIFQSILDFSKTTDHFEPKILPLIAETYIMEDNIMAAMTIYQTLIHDYALDSLNIPLHVAQIYKTRQEYAEAAIAYQNAVKIYENLIHTHNNSHVELEAYWYLALLYKDQSKWNEAVTTLNLLLNKAPNEKTAKEAIVEISNICITKLRKPEMAKAILKTYLKIPPPVQIRPFVNKILEKLTTVEPNS